MIAKTKPMMLSAVAACALVQFAAMPAAAGDARAYEVAQAHDVMIDEYGRRVLVDRRTGEIVGFAKRRKRRRIIDRLLDRLDGDPEEGFRRHRGESAWGGRDGRDGVRLDRWERRNARRGRPLEPAPRLAPQRPVAPESQQAMRARPAPTDDLTTGSVRRDTAPVISRSGPSLTRSATAKLQIFLDRAGYSPGAIDGRMGSNVRKAVEAWTRANGQGGDLYDKGHVERLLAQSGEPFTTYTITAADLDRPYIATVPVDYAEKAKLQRLAYTSPIEMLAERFHTSRAYLREINPRANFYRVGTILTVPNVGQDVAGKGRVHYIVADKGRKQLRAYDRQGALVTAYPATIGSASTPSPSGTHSVERIALDPEYTYNPKINFTQGNNTEILRIPPGPNGPVGSVWIALSKKTYGIHGTPDPERIGKTNSNGCIRLTNWDAKELAGMVAKGVTVEFLE